MLSKTRIPEQRDRLQSKILVIAVASLLALLALYVLLISGGLFDFESSVRNDLLLSFTFALLAWALRAATRAAAVWGGVICLLITVSTGEGARLPLRSGLAPLATLFLLTFIATRLGRARKAAAGLAEPRRGRNAAQVIANLGMAGLVPAAIFCGLFDRTDQDGVLLTYFGAYALPVLLLAALCEATADTVSSEIGQAFGGVPIMLTTGRKMRPGTNGAVTLLGTLAGTLAAGMVAIAGLWAMHMGLKQALLGLLAGIAGLFFDSLLGATVERAGWLGNDLVNFSSTVFAVLLALAALLLFH